MLLKKQRLKQIQQSRVQNQNWKDEIAKQILEKQLFKQNQKKMNDQLSRMEQEKIKRYQQQITDRIQDSHQSRGKRDKHKFNNFSKDSIALQPDVKIQKVNHFQNAYAKNIKEEKIKSNPSIKKSSFVYTQEDEIPLFSFADHENPQNNNNNKIKRVQKSNTMEDQIIVLSFPEEQKRKERKSTSKKRQQTVNSRRNTQGSVVFQVQALEQQNKKLKQNLSKANLVIQNLMKMIKSQSGSESMSKHAQSIILGNEIGETEYVRFEHNSFVNQLSNKIFFPSLDFKTNSLIKEFNVGAAKKATSLNSIQNGTPGQQ